MFDSLFSAVYLYALGYTFGGFLLSFIILYSVWSYLLRFSQSRFAKSEFYFIPITLKDTNLSAVLFILLVALYVGIELGFPGTMTNSIWGKIWGVLLLIFAFEAVVKLVINTINAYYSKSKKKASISSAVLMSVKRIVAIVLYTIAIIIIINYLSTEIGNVMIVLSILFVVLLFAAYYKYIQNVIAGLNLLQGIVHEGDLISINGKKGFVEKIMDQKTIMHLLSGTRLIISNEEFLNSTVESYSLPYGSQIFYEIYLSKDALSKDFDKVMSIANRIGSRTEGIISQHKPKMFLLGKKNGMYIIRVRFLIESNVNVSQITDTFCGELAKGLKKKLLDCKLW